MLNEAFLISGSYLRQRCSEPIDLYCPDCGGTCVKPVLGEEGNGVECPTCMRAVTPLVKCARCKESLAFIPDANERPCLSIQAYRNGAHAPAFAPDEPLWLFKSDADSEEAVTAESNLRQRFIAGELHADTLVRGPSQDAYIPARATPTFQDVARPRALEADDDAPLRGTTSRPRNDFLAVAPVADEDPLWEYKATAEENKQTVPLSELMRLFEAGTLDAETLVRQKGRGPGFVPAERRTLFASIARPRVFTRPAPPARAPRTAPVAPVPAVTAGPPPIPARSVASPRPSRRVPPPLPTAEAAASSRAPVIGRSSGLDGDSWATFRSEYAEQWRTLREQLRAQFTRMGADFRSPAMRRAITGYFQFLRGLLGLALLLFVFVGFAKGCAWVARTFAETSK